MIYTTRKREIEDEDEDEEDKIQILEASTCMPIITFGSHPKDIWNIKKI